LAALNLPSYAQSPASMQPNIEWLRDKLIRLFPFLEREPGVRLEVHSELRP
jgi:hypothetical protein